MTRTLLLLPLLLSSILRADWRSDADARIEKIRKGDFVVHVLDEKGRPVRPTKLEFALQRHAFLFGTALAAIPLTDQGAKGEAYRRFVLENFSAVVCENEMKWYDNEVEAGKKDYSRGDALFAFAQKHGLPMRGHCLFWEKNKYVQPWLRSLGKQVLREKIADRIQASVTRYAGGLIAWDVNNEMLDGSFYRDAIGLAGIADMFKEAARLDPKAKLFVNEYSILGNPDKTTRYLNLIRELQALGAPIGGIGIQSHDSDRFLARQDAAAKADNRVERADKRPLTPESFLATLDTLWNETKLPVHLTEVSAKAEDPIARAEALSTLLRLAFSHESVECVTLWGFEEKSHWMGAKAALMNADGTVNEAGRTISKLLREEWTSRGEAKSAADGFHLRGFFGSYQLRITLPDGQVLERQVELKRGRESLTVKI